jgi:hypothetical protein
MYYYVQIIKHTRLHKSQAHTHKNKHILQKKKKKGHITGLYGEYFRKQNTSRKVMIVRLDVFAILI